MLSLKASRRGQGGSGVETSESVEGHRLDRIRVVGARPRAAALRLDEVQDGAVRSANRKEGAAAEDEERPEAVEAVTPRLVGCPAATVVLPPDRAKQLHAQRRRENGTEETDEA